MKIMEKNNNAQKGLTLVEILAALVILGIVFIGIMTVFPQMTLFNQKTETKLDTMNLARIEMSEFISNTNGKITPDPTTKLIPVTQIKPILESQFNETAGIVDTHIDSIASKDEYVAYTFNAKGDLNNEFKIEIQVFDEPDLSGTISLYKTILKIYTLEDHLSSETYGYIEVIGGE